MTRVELITPEEMPLIGITYEPDNTKCHDKLTRTIYGSYQVDSDDDIIYKTPWATDSQAVRLQKVSAAFIQSGYTKINSIYLYVDDENEASFKHAFFSIRILGY